jgi:hypothetical protein
MTAIDWGNTKKKKKKQEKGQSTTGKAQEQQLFK